MNKKVSQHVCAVCGQSFPARNLVPGGAVRDLISAEILRDHPEWSPESFICRPDLTQYRMNFVRTLLQSERGELSSLELDLLSELGKK